MKNVDVLLGRHAGLFSNFFSVLGALAMAEKTGRAVAVRFDEGAYLEAARGPNWWEYYFERVSDCDPMSLLVESRVQGKAEAANLAFQVVFQREKSSQLIRRYIRLLGHVTAGLDEFWRENVGNRYCIGLHLRGTDKVLETPLPDWQRLFGFAERLADKRPADSWRFFVATDEEKLLDAAKARFGGLVVSQKVFRSTDGHPLHKPFPKTSRNLQPEMAMLERPRYDIGLEAIRDALLLAKCDALIGGFSNLLLAAAAFNPAIPCIPGSTFDPRDRDEARDDRVKMLAQSLVSVSTALERLSRTVSLDHDRRRRLSFLPNLLRRRAD